MHASTFALDVSHLWQAYPRKKALHWKSWFGGVPQKEAMSRYALEDINFQQATGRVLCVLGENGAGKTTLIRTLTTLMKPHQGDAWVMGYHTQKQAVLAKTHIGVVFQQNHFNRYLSIWDNVKLHARLHGLTDREGHKRMTELFEGLGMIHLKDRRPDALSGGQQRRVAMIRALVHRPKLLFLDEPSTGLDPQARRQVWRMIKTLQADYALSVVLTTHYMEEAEALSDDMLLLHHGRIRFHGTKQALKHYYSSLIQPTNLTELPPGTIHYRCQLSRWLTPEEAHQLQTHFPAHALWIPSASDISMTSHVPHIEWYVTPQTSQGLLGLSHTGSTALWHDPFIQALATHLHEAYDMTLEGVYPYQLPLEAILNAITTH
ncbi:MAG: ATP-binding cassette domain-containing protein [Vampirovibrionales bacterium]